MNVLERTHYYATGVGCGRSEDTFDGGANNPGEGAFVVNISGPVRAIRSYIGANSYQYTVNTDVFYPDRQDTVTELRGHAGLPGYGSADDFVTGTTGLRYSDPQNTGVAINGAPDTVTPITYTTGSTAPAMWQMVSGPQGSVVTVRTLDTDITGSQRHVRVPGPEPGVARAVHRRRRGVGSERRERHLAGHLRPGHRPDAHRDPRHLRRPSLPLLRRPEPLGDDAAQIDAQARTPLQLTVTG